jgi:hypothetical protein
VLAKFDWMCPKVRCWVCAQLRLSRWWYCLLWVVSSSLFFFFWCNGALYPLDDLLRNFHLRTLTIFYPKTKNKMN